MLFGETLGSVAGICGMSTCRVKVKCLARPGNF